MRLLKPGRFSEIVLTFFGTQKKSPGKNFVNNLHTYITPLTILILCKIHHVGCLHKIEATYMIWAIFEVKSCYERIKSLKAKQNSLTFPSRNFLFHGRNKLFHGRNNTF